MAGRSSTALYYYLALFLHLVLLTECNYGVRYGDRAKRLHVAEYEEPRYRKPLAINRRNADPRDRDDDGETSFGRTRRDVPLPEHPNNNPNITTKVGFGSLDHPKVAAVAAVAAVTAVTAVTAVAAVATASQFDRSRRQRRRRR